MSQWKLNSLLILCAVFLLFLLLFNFGCYLLGSTVESIPFRPTSRGYELFISNLSISNLPISVESYPPSSSKSFISILCGDEVEVYDHSISLSEEYFLSVFSLCDSVKIEVWPKHPGVGLWLRGHYPLQMFLLMFLRILFISIVAYSFYVFFRSGKNNSVLRSTLITQTTTLLILDPLKILISFFPSIASLHEIISCIGWWRATAEIFAEYGPLVRQKSSFYRIFASIPAAILLATTISHKFSRYTFSTGMFIIGSIGGIIVPIAATFFLFKARKVNGVRALSVHIISGSLAMTVAYFMKMLRVVNDDFRDSFVCETAEISFVGAFAMFQTIFQTGEGREEAQPFIAQGNMKRNESIDGMLNGIVDLDNNVFFDLSGE